MCRGGYLLTDYRRHYLVRDEEKNSQRQPTHLNLFWLPIKSDVKVNIGTHTHILLCCYFQPDNKKEK